MTRLNKLAIAMTVAVSSLTVVPTASALPMSESQCESAGDLRDIYWYLGWAFAGIGNYNAANYWYAKSYFQDALVVAGCGFGMG